MSAPDAAPPAPPPPVDCGSVFIPGVCANAISYSQFATSVWLSAVGGLALLILWAWLRGTKTWRPIYHKRAGQMGDMLRRVPPLRFDGLHRAWSYLEPVFTMSDGDLMQSAGLDTVVLIRFVVMGVQMFLPISVIACAVLLPINMTGGALSASTANSDKMMTFTLSNVVPRSDRLWAPFCCMIAFTAYACAVLHYHYRSFTLLRVLFDHIIWADYPGPLLSQHPGARGGVKGLEEGRGPSAQRAQDQSVAVVGVWGASGGAKAKWRAAGRTLLTLASPWHMHREDERFVAECLDAAEASLAAAAADLDSGGTQDLSAAAEAADGGAEHPSELAGDVGSLPRSESAAGGGADGRALVLASAADWPELIAAPVPEAVCPWWLLPEETPAAVNPMLSASPVLLGKTDPKRRRRLLTAAAGIGGRHIWQPAAPYAVLFRAKGPRSHDALQRVVQLEFTVAGIPNAAAPASPAGKAKAAAAAAPAAGDANGSVVKGGASWLFLGGRRRRRARAGAAGNASAEQESGAEAGPEACLDAVLRHLFPTSYQELVPVYNHKKVDQLIEHWDGAAAEVARAERALAALDPGGELSAKIAAALDDALVAGGVALDVEQGGGVGTAGTAGTAVSSADFPGLDMEAAQKAAKALVASYPKKSVEGRVAVQVARRALALAHRERLEWEIIAARAEALSKPLGTAYFALFTSQRDASTALNGSIGLVPEINMTAEPAPGPDDVNWEGLWAGWAERKRRTLYLLLPLTLVMLFPIGAMTGALTNLPLAVCGGSEDTNEIYWSWFCGAGAGYKFLQEIISGIVPVIISTFYDTFVMPMVLYLLSQAARCHPSFSQLDCSVIHRFFTFDVINTFFGAVFAGSILQQLGPALSGGHVWALLGQAIPSASNFFANYIMVHALFTNPFRFVWPHDGTVLFVLFRAVGLARPHCARDEWIIRSPPSYRAGRHYGSFLLYFLMGLSYCAVAPLLAPMTLCFWLTAFMSWRYCAIHFYEPCYEGGGRAWQLTFRLLIWTLWIANIFTALVLVALRAYWLSGALAIIATLGLWLFHTHVVTHLARFVEAAPLQGAAAAPRALFVPREAYMPPPLRHGAVGWAPEWGRCWEKYGIPRYSTIR